MELLKKYEALYKAQDEILNLLAKSQIGLYLTGGTALNRFILDNYRFSDDIDLFTVEQGITARAELNDFVSFLKDNGVNFITEIDSFGFKRLLLKDSNLKIDLVYDSTQHIGKFIEKDGFLLDNINNIFINKLDASYSRNEIRDYFDIYIILKNYDMDLLISYEKLQLKSATSLEEICSNMRVFSSIDISMVDKNKLPVKDDKILDDFKQNSQAFFKEYFFIDTIKQDKSSVKKQR